MEWIGDVDELWVGRLTFGWVTQSPILASVVDITSLGLHDEWRGSGQSLRAIWLRLGSPDP